MIWAEISPQKLMCSDITNSWGHSLHQWINPLICSSLHELLGSRTQQKEVTEMWVFLKGVSCSQPLPLFPIGCFLAAMSWSAFLSYNGASHSGAKLKTCQNDLFSFKLYNFCPSKGIITNIRVKRGPSAISL